MVSIGLGLDDLAHDDDALIAGEVLSVRAGLRDDGAAIVSAMIAVQENGNQILWQSP